IVDFLNTVRTVGKTSFTLGSIAIFFFIIWIAHLLQKYIGYFFGDTEDEIMPDKKTKLGTSVLLVRLVILTAGFFLGILASGIPLDRVTIIIGALGVGIGLGLQNIVNNLVSGVILAIERPIQVGDLIEIGSNSGRVKEIGIRSSRIVTPDGAEVIIPNGDMLSQKLTNWTLSNSYLRGEIILKLANGTDIDKARKLVSELMTANEEIMQKPEPQVLVRSVGQSGTELQVLFWAFDINKWVQLKSDMLQKISLAFAKESIIIV
ncbi:MAG TPA: mechanosensitive ion channel domain-containing protein, partial [Puia sp.]|nr:mechanosensitive ion channel domain-containing protein [Puia sp.]